MKRGFGVVRAVVVLSLVAGVVSTAQLAVSPVIGPARADASTGSAGLFVPAVGRLLDTRNGTGGYSTPMPAGGVRAVTAAGRAGIPASGVSAVALTLTAVGAGSIGAVSVAPGDVTTPTGAALVFNPGDSVSNTALVALHADGALRVLADHAVNLIIDVQGYFTAGTATAPGGFVAVSQARIADTRSGAGVPLAKVGTGSSVMVQAGGSAGVPAGASAVYANITVLNPTAIGYLRAYAADTAAPTTGALDFDDSATAQSVAIPLSGDGRFTVLVGAGGPVDLTIDIQGYFTPAAATGAFTPAAVRLLDTRAVPVRTLAGNSVTKVSVAGVAGIPAVADGLGAVALNLRTVQPATGAASGYLRLWPADQPEPATSNINYTTQNVYRTDLAIIAPAADGTVNIRNGGPGPVDLVLDVEGWFSYSPGPKPNAADALESDHGPILTPTEPDAVPGTELSQLASGVFTNPSGQPVANIPVTISVPETSTTADGSESERTVLATVRTDAEGAWSYTPPATLPSAVQAVADANSGVLNLEAVAMGTAPDGTMLSATAGAPVDVSTSEGSTPEAVDASGVSAPQPVAMHVMPNSDTTAAAPTEAEAAESDASVAQASGVSYRPPTWQTNNAPSDAAYNPDLVAGVDYSTASVTAVSSYYPYPPCRIYDSVSKTTVAYTTVGEAHAYWDTKASFRFNSTLSNNFKIEVSVDGVHWKASSYVRLETTTGRSTGFSNQGPYFGRQFQVPIKYRWMKTRYYCDYNPYGFTTSYSIRPVGYYIPAGGYAGRMGNNVANNDGFGGWYRSNPAYRGRLQPNTFFAITRGKSITYGSAATVWGVGITAETIYNSNHEQRIDAGRSLAASHDIWGAKGSLNGDPGTIYSW
ncbi:MAG TPA: hypothetical protein VGB75_11730 [Jatrophihabitans sp.]|uniref:hypothetical protein n=1 Tax=Jatrophihabitans sp. TaxID=1932789 RepID=UPI002EED0AE0